MMTVPNHQTALLNAAMRYARALLRHHHYQSRFDALYEVIDKEYIGNIDVNSAHQKRLTRLTTLALRTLERVQDTHAQLTATHAQLLFAIAAVSEEA